MKLDNTSHDVQLALRAFVEEFHGNCRFIFTCNFLNKIIAPLHSRCSVINFQVKGNQKAKLAAAFFNRVRSILESEGVGYDPKVVAEVINKHFPDFRRVLNELQRYSVNGQIDTGLLANINEVRIAELTSALKDKEFTTVRKWVVENLDNDPNAILRSLYDSSTLLWNLVRFPSSFLSSVSISINLLSLLTRRSTFWQV